MREAEARPVRICRNLRKLGAEREPVAVDRVHVLCAFVGGITNVEVQASTGYIFERNRACDAIRGESR